MKNQVTIKDIAREAGVSTALVSFVMTNLRSGTNVYRVNKETTEQVLKVAHKLNYQPNIMARNLKYGNSNTIGVVFSDISNPFFSEIARHMEDIAWKYGYSLLIGSTDENADRLHKLIDVFLGRRVDGLVVVPCEGSEDAILQTFDRGIPTVLIDRDCIGFRGQSVVMDDENTAKELTDRLLSWGCKRIEMLSYTMGLSVIRDREAGYLKSMEEAGLGSLAYINRIPRSEKGANVEQIIKESKARGADAFIFATNTISMWGISSILSSGFTIPGDFRVASCARNDAYKFFGMDIIYTEQPAQQFAEESIKCLLDQIHGTETARKKIVLSSEIIDTGKH